MNGARQILSPSKEARLVASHLSLKAFLSTDIGKRCANGDWGNNNQQQAQQAQQGQSQGQQQAQGQQNSQYGLPQYKKLSNGSNLSPSDISRAKEYFKNNPNAKRMQTSDGKNFIFRNKDGHLISAPIGDTGNQAFIEALKRRKKMLTN